MRRRKKKRAPFLQNAHIIREHFVRETTKTQKILKHLGCCVFPSDCIARVLFSVFFFFLIHLQSKIRKHTNIIIYKIQVRALNL